MSSVFRYTHRSREMCHSQYFVRDLRSPCPFYQCSVLPVFEGVRDVECVLTVEVYLNVTFSVIVLFCVIRNSTKNNAFHYPLNLC